MGAEDSRSTGEKVITKGLSFVALFGLGFVIAKLTGAIDWSWWWVTLPIWGALALGAFVGLMPLPGRDDAVVTVWEAIRRVQEITVQCGQPDEPLRQEAAAEIMALFDVQAQRIAELQNQVQGHAERIAAQSELLSRRAEKPARTFADVSGTFADKSNVFTAPEQPLPGEEELRREVEEMVAYAADGPEDQSISVDEIMRTCIRPMLARNAKLERVVEAAKACQWMPMTVLEHNELVHRLEELRAALAELEKP